MNLRTASATKLIGAGSLVLIAGVGWLGVLGPSSAGLAAARDDIASTAAQNEVLSSQLVRLQHQAVHLTGSRRAARALSTRFPPTADQPGLFAQVTGAASEAGILPRNVTALTPTPPTVGSAEATEPVTTPAPTGNELARQTVTVSVSGDYAATQKLLRNLERIPRAFLMSAVTIGAGTGPRSYTTTVTGDMFVMPPAVDPKSVTVTTRDLP